MAALDWTFAPFASLEREFDRLRRQMDSVFDRIGPEFATGYPPLNIYERDEDVVVALQAPGMRKEDLGIELRENTLTVTGRRNAPERAQNASTLREESVFGEFRRSVRLEARLAQDKVEAQLKDGILWLRLPKSEEAKAKRISINA
jgi:HSP20 family protein